MSSHCTSLSDVGIQTTPNALYMKQRTINAALKTAEDDIHRLRALRNNTDRDTKRRKLEDRIRRYHIALASLKTVPNEIWMRIFELYCRSGRLSTCGKIKPPVVLMQVCSTWRQIVLSTPKLWSDVHINKETGLARMWLERAGSIPRAFHMTKSSCYNKYPRLLEEIRNILCSFPFRKLHLTDSDAAHLQFHKIPEESLLPLEDLVVTMPSAYGTTTVTSVNPHRFPNLVSLHIRTRHIPCFHVPNPFPMWKKLRVLRLECRLTVSKCLDILRHAPSVEDCTLRPLRKNPLPDHDRSIEHANLQILKLSLPSFHTISRFLDCLTCPNLHTIIAISKSRYPWDASSLLSFPRCAESLMSLKIHRLYATADISLVLGCLPLLEVLTIRCERITARTREKIGKGELGGCLRELHDWSTHNLSNLLRVCELRRNVTQGLSQNNPTTITCLKKVSVRYKKVLRNPDVMCRIFDLRKDGIEFEVYQSDRLAN